MYRIIYAKKISKFLKKVSLNQLQKIKTKMELVARDPFSNHPNLTSLKGMTVGYRLRVGNLRVVYELDNKNKTIIVWKIDFRGSVYKF